MISDGLDFFFRDLHAFRKWPPEENAKLSMILWKFGKFWKRISVVQIQCGGEGNPLHTIKFIPDSDMLSPYS